MVDGEVAVHVEEPQAGHRKRKGKGGMELQLKDKEKSYSLLCMTVVGCTAAAVAHEE